MCEFSGKLIAWMDRELPGSEAVDLERHVAVCAECRERLAAYECASRAFNAYCEATFAAETRRKLPRRLPAAGVAAGIAAAAILALLMLSRHHLAQVPTRVPVAAEAPHIAGRTEPPQAAEAARSAAAPIRQYVSAARPQSHNSERATTADAPVQASQLENISPFPVEPPIQIAIPADSMFPPGAVPPGISFTAELTISADGSAEQVGLRPHLAGFERRAHQP
jgi:hypothetical protein